MVLIPIRIFVVFLLVSLLVSSCGSSRDEGLSSSSDPEKIIVTDTLPDITTAWDTEFSASHILITWYTPVRKIVSGNEEEIPESIDSMSVAGDEAPEQIHILTIDERKALVLIRDIQDDILSGQATFEEMAFNYSHCTSATDSGRLPDFTRGAFTEELDSTVFALEPGEISGIIRTRFGYHLVKRLGS